MIQLLMMLSLSSINPSVPATTAQFQPCIWPKTCVEQAPILAQFQPCVWPKVCSEKTSGFVSI